MHEPAADLAVVVAIASSLRNKPVLPGVAVFGEVGLAGEVRGAMQPDLRVREAAQMGFTRCILPARGHAENAAGRTSVLGCELYEIDTVVDALEGVFA